MVSLHHAPGLVDRDWGWGPAGGFIPLLLFLLLIVFAVWAIVRVTGRGPVAAQASTPAPRVVPRDGALEEVRLRYARGELTREEFVQRSRDLGGTQPEAERREVAPPES
jgi:putative membrane protein